MRILVTNDDGIHAPGLDVAETIARALSDDVWVVAPETEQSGASHSLTLAGPLRLRPVRERRYAVSGTPTDCVLMACLHLLKDQPPGLGWIDIQRIHRIAAARWMKARKFVSRRS
jgi:5'-nucleotidase